MFLQRDKDIEPNHFQCSSLLCNRGGTLPTSTEVEISGAIYFTSSSIICVFLIAQATTKEETSRISTTKVYITKSDTSQSDTSHSDISQSDTSQSYTSQSDTCQSDMITMTLLVPIVIIILISLVLAIINAISCKHYMLYVQHVNS